MFKHVLFASCAVGLAMVASLAWGGSLADGDYQATYACSQHRTVSHMGPMEWHFPARVSSGRVNASREYLALAGPEKGKQVMALITGLVHADGTVELSVRGGNFNSPMTGRTAANGFNLSGPMLNDAGQSVRSCTFGIRRG